MEQLERYVNLRNAAASPIEVEMLILFAESVNKYEQSKSAPAFLQSMLQDDEKSLQYIEEFLQSLSWNYHWPFAEDLFIEGLKLASEKQIKMEKPITIEQFFQLKEQIYEEHFTVNYPQGIVPEFIYELLFQLVQDESQKDILNVYADNNFVLHVKEKAANVRKGYFEIPNHKTAFNFYLLNYLYDLKQNDFHIGDPLLEPGFTDRDSLQPFDAVISAPPFDPIYHEDFIKEDKFHRFEHLQLSKRDSTSAFILHVVQHLNKNGKAAMLLHGSPLFQTGKRGSVRKFLLEHDFVEGIIALPSGLLRGTSIATYVLVINKNKPAELKQKIIFLDAGELYEKKQKNKFLSESNIREIVNAFCEKRETEIVTVVSVEKVMQNEGILDPMHYAVRKEIVIDGYGKAKIDEEKFKTLPMTRLDEYCDVITGVNVKKSETGETVKVINGKALQNEKILLSEIEAISVEKKDAYMRSKIEPNDILMVSRGAAAKFAIADEYFAEEEVFATANLFILRPKKDVSPAYVLAYLTSPFASLELEKIKKGTTIPMYTTKDVKQLPIPKVDLSVQTEIQQAFLEANRTYEETIAQATHELNQAKIGIYKKMGLMDALQ